MQPDTTTRTHRAFRIYVALVLTLILVVLIGILGVLVYGGIQVSAGAKDASSKIDNLNTQLNGVKTNLQVLNGNLE